ncbi:RNA polymerase factor sigma-54 [Uliginosibacterium paludis]|uniref:RNA polymerase sigma-54 factor n=1 Tax=Uliginosibacterium paludis TaxID=1615952 RepID=A0ABV2CTH6_9RHOO
MNALVLNMGQHTQQTLSPRMQHAVRLLQMSSMDYSHQIYDTVANNPFLDIDESEAGQAAEAGESPLSSVLAAAEAASQQEVAELPGATVRDGSEQTENDHDIWRADDPTGAPRSNDGPRTSAIDLQREEESLVDHLCTQISVMPLSARDRAIAASLIGSLDEDGYLRTPLEEIAVISALKPRPSREEMHIGLSRIQALDPAGVGARDVRECLLLQATDIVCPERQALARTIIHQHLDLLAANDLNGLTRALDCSAADLQPVLDCIRRLKPRPGSRFSTQQAQYVIPDVVVRKSRGQWTTHLNPAVIPRVRVYQSCVDMFRRHHTGQNPELAAHLQEAQWTVNNIEQRFSTILSIAEAIVRHQALFLEYGPLAMKPLGLREIAEEAGVHESTVSRVTNNKYMATPQGVFELKHFFSRSLATAVGGECSATSIRRLIQELIASENTRAPLSDAAIGRLLARQGFVLARRTVTKYRQALRIEPFERRRTLA